MHISHRGGSRENLENTMQAFKHAVALGTDMLEMDVCITKDKKVLKLESANKNINLGSCSPWQHAKEANWDWRQHRGYKLKGLTQIYGKCACRLSPNTHGRYKEMLDIEFPIARRCI